MADEGYGVFVTKENMHRDGVLPFNQCANVFIKEEPSFLDPKFYELACDREYTNNMYVNNFMKSADKNGRKMIKKYHPHKESVWMTDDTSDTGNDLHIY